MMRPTQSNAASFVCFVGYSLKGDEPPYLSVGTEVSAKYKGAFCEAKVRKVDRVVKCKIAFKPGFGSHTVLDTQVKGVLRVGANIEARHPDKKEFIEGSITKIQDCSQYTVVFDDGDITTLRRSALCLKSGRHFAESETLDQLPLTHPEHFGNPVVGGRRGTRRRGGDESSGDEETPRKDKPPAEREAEIGKVVCVELGDKKKVKDNWFPGLVVAPTAQDTVRIRVKEEYLVRSFKDGRYYTVPKKEANEFTREIGQKVDNHTLKTAVEKALTFLDKDELPPHWDRELLFGLLDSDGSDSDTAMDSDSSDDEPREEKDHFVAQLYKFMDDRGTPINSCPSVCSQDLDLYKLFKLVNNLNGYNRVSNQNQWKLVSTKLGLGTSPGIVTQVKHAYKKLLHSFEDFYRKLGCTMVSHPRSSRARMKGGRALIRDKDRATPVNLKGEPGSTPKREDENAEDASVSTIEVKRAAAKEDIAKTRVRQEESATKPLDTKEEPPSDPEPIRPISSLRKKFPTLKASPRTKEVETPIYPLVPAAVKRLPSQRTKRILLEPSVDVWRLTADETARLMKPSEEQQRSTTRSKSKEEQKTAVKKETSEPPRITKGLPKNNDAEPAKRGKVAQEEAKKGKDLERRVRRGGSDDSSTAVPSTSSPAAPAPSTSFAVMRKNRKRRNTDVASDDTKSRPYIPRSRSVLVGDILKVYYGSAADPNGLYEAKVLDIEVDDSGEQAFLVHYAGWNSRYDEWVKRNKIAENLSRTVRRVKSSPAKIVKTIAAKKKNVGGNGSKADSTRSTTPSSITSSSSRTKSPATPGSVSRRSKRHERPPTPEVTTTRRLRRVSAHTDISLDSDTDSESVNYESDPESKQDKGTSEATSASDDSRKKEPKKMDVKPPVKRKSMKKIIEDENVPEALKRKKPRLVKVLKQEKEVIGEPSDLKEEIVKTPIIQNEGELPKGTEFDLNEIRSELKGIDKAVKISSEPQVSSTEIEIISNPKQLDVRLAVGDEDPVVVKEEDVEMLATNESLTPSVEESVKEEEVVIIDSPLQITEEKENLAGLDDVKDDIYEFKEPEPFDFQEVRRPIRIFDEPIERSPEKSLSVKKSSGASTSMRVVFEKIEKRDCVPFEIDTKSRFRKSVAKKPKEAVDTEKKDDNNEEKEAGPPIKEAPQLEIEEFPPPTLTGPVEEVMLVEESPPHKSSPEPPCLEPVMEASPFHPPELSPVLTREDPPQLDINNSSSDSESDERLVIVNEEETCSLDLKVEAPNKAQPLETSSLPLPEIITLPHASPPMLLVEESNDLKMSPLPELRVKRVDDRLKTPITIPNPPSPQKPVILDPEDVVDECEEDGEGGSMRSLMCDEVIPGSPAAKEPGDELEYSAPSGSGGGAAAVMENTPPTTPPTTPESNISSPREDRVGSSLDNESSKSHRDSCERDLEMEAQRNRGIKYGKRCEKEPPDSPSKRRRRSRKRSESTLDASKRNSGRQRKLRDASDSDDTSEGSFRLRSSDTLLSNRSPRPSKYNFIKELAPELDAQQRINFLQTQLHDLRKAYVGVKSQLSSLDRKRKKLRRKEREERAEKAAIVIAKLQDATCA